MDELKIAVKSTPSASKFRTIRLAPVLNKFVILRLYETLTLLETQVSLALNQAKVRVKRCNFIRSLS